MTLNGLSGGPEESRRTTAAGEPESLVELREVTVRFRLNRRLFGRHRAQFAAVDGVSLSVKRGHTLGLVGGTGSGKSTVAQAIMGMVEPASGSIVIGGREVGEGREVERRRLVQFVMQDPYSSLDPRMKVGAIVAEPFTLGRRRGSNKAEVRERVTELLEVVGLRAGHAERFPNQFSGGQRQRIAIARALASRPEVIVLDEPTSALDTSVKAQILNLLRRLQEEVGVTYLMISHDLATVAYLASEVAVMLRGRIVELAPTGVFLAPRHPYTLELVQSVPGASHSAIGAAPPSAAQAEALPQAACRFASGCPLRARLGNPKQCLEADPPLAQIAPHHWVACHFANAEEAIPPSVSEG